jgi:hypothetical protein
MRLARAWTPSRLFPIASISTGSPSEPTRLRTITSVSDQVQFVVQSSLTRSSKTVGERKRRPAPARAIHS